MSGAVGLCSGVVVVTTLWAALLVPRSHAAPSHQTTACEKKLIELKAENAKLKADIEAIYKAENGG